MRRRSAAGRVESVTREVEPDAHVSTPSGAGAHVRGESIEIHDARGRVIVAFDASNGTLELRATGDLVLRAAGRVVLEGEDVAITAQRRATVGGAVVELAAGVLEARASRVFERLGEVYRELEGTLHTTASVVRTIVRGTFDVYARDARIASEEDTAIDGKHVLLG